METKILVALMTKVEISGRKAGSSLLDPLPRWSGLLSRFLGRIIKSFVESNK